MIGPTQHCASSASSGSGLPDDSAVIHLTNTIRSSSQEVRDDGTRQALCISIIRVRASRPNVRIVFICKGTPSQFTRVQHDCTCPAQRIISIIRVRVSPHSDSAVFHLQGIPSQFTKYVMIGPAWHRASPRIIGIIRVRASQQVFHLHLHRRIPSQFTKVHDEWIRPAPCIISVIRVRASRGNDSAVFHLHVGMPTQFRRVRDDWTRRNRASSASSGSGLALAMILQFFICKGIPS